MKRFYQLFLTAVLTLLASANAMAGVEEFSGKTLSVGEAVTTLETGKWYFLYNPYTVSYVKEGDGNTLGVTDVAPQGLDAAENAGYLVKLEDSGTEKKYFLISGLGNYYRNAATTKHNGTEATNAHANNVYLIDTFGSAGHWSLRSNGMYYLQNSNGTLKGATSIGSAGGDRDWVFREAKLTSVDDLTGGAYVRYILNKGGLVRLANRRSPQRYLSDDMNQTMGAAADANTLQQVWILAKNGEGYSLRNGATGRYLTANDNFRSPSGSPTTLYIQLSPNGTANDSYINISEKSNFADNSCLNLNGDGTTLFKWSYSGDHGSDWTISVVENFTLEQVNAGLLEQSGFKVPEVGKYYRIRNMSNDRYMNEDYSNNTLTCEDSNADKLSQYWTLVATTVEGKYYFKNVCTERYITRQGGTLSTQYKTQLNRPTQGFTITRTSDESNFLYYLIDNGNVGMHFSNGNVVGWYTTDIAASTWGFEEAELTDEFIQDGRNSLAIYSDLKLKMSDYKAALVNLFADNACTVLKDEIQALSDEQLAENADFQALNSDIQAMILKVKNNTWKSYTGANGYSRDFEKFFRIRDDYQVYSHYQKMSYNQYCGMSNSFGKLSGPTGIVGKTGDIIYIFLEEEPKSDCTLQVEVIADSKAPGDHQTGATTNLHKGLNAVVLSNQSTVYIFYQLNDPEKYLANYPKMKIHIEGGEVQGYWDATRGMTNADWLLLREKLLDKSNVLNLKTKRLVFAMRKDLVLNAIKEDNEMEGLMRVWNTILQNEEDIMGFQEKLEGRFNNVWNAFSVDHGYMYATTYGTYYSDGTIETIMSYKKMTQSGGGAMWGPSHEMGHNHQACINGVGSTETSNNLFSNINVYLHGVSTSRGDAAETCFEDFANGLSWVQRGTWAQARFYYQLYMYYHMTGRNPEFYPRLFTLLRQDPINKGSWDNTLEADSDGDGKNDIKGGYKSYGKNDYLHIAKKMCDAAGEDLSEFFEAYGMFIPVKDFWVGDYSNYWMTTTQADIDAALQYMHKYPKAGNIIFIEDRIKPSPSIYGGCLEGVPTGDTRVPISNEDCNQIGTHGDVGQYSDYVDDYMTDGYYYTTTTSSGITTYKISGEGAVGFKILDNNGKMVYLTNKKSFTIPRNVLDKLTDGFKIMACEGNGYDVLVPYGPALYRGMATAYYAGSEKPHTIYYYGTGTGGKSEIAELPANSVVYVTPDQTSKKTPTEDIFKTANVVSGEGICQNLVIDGDKPMFIAKDFTAEAGSFKKAGTGYQALALPFAVAEGYEGTIENGKMVKEVEAISAGLPVVVNGNAEFTLANAAISAANFQKAETGFVLDAEGKAVVAQENISPFTFLFDEAFTLGDGQDAISSVSADLNAEENIYDLSGRRVTKAAKGIYIVGGRKILK